MIALDQILPPLSVDISVIGFMTYFNAGKPDRIGQGGLCDSPVPDCRAHRLDHAGGVSMDDIGCHRRGPCMSRKRRDVQLDRGSFYSVGG